MNGCGVRRITEDVEAVSAHHLESLLVQGSSLFRCLLCDCLIRLRARIKNPPDIESHEKKCHCRQNEISSKSCAGFRSVIDQHRTPSGIFVQTFRADKIYSK